MEVRDEAGELRGGLSTGGGRRRDIFSPTGGYFHLVHLPKLSNEQANTQAHNPTHIISNFYVGLFIGGGDRSAVAGGEIISPAGGITQGPSFFCAWVQAREAVRIVHA